MTRKRGMATPDRPGGVRGSRSRDPVWSSEFGVRGSGFGVRGSEFGVRSSGSRFASAAGSVTRRSPIVPKPTKSYEICRAFLNGVLTTTESNYIGIDRIFNPPQIPPISQILRKLSGPI
jgi:hypothetical protein